VFFAACASAPVSVEPPICDPSPGEWTALEKGNVSFSPARSACWSRRTSQNALHAVTDPKRRSPTIRRAIDHCKVPVVVAHYDALGRVTVLQYINFEK
jgi:hypothetical protein